MSRPDKPKQFCSFNGHINMSDCLLALDKEKELSECKSDCFCSYMKNFIIGLRKQSDNKILFSNFNILVEDKISFIVKNFNMRWLVSILDTYADHGDSVTRRNAMIVSIIVTWERFCQTALTSSKYPLKTGFPDHLYDGVLKYGLMKESDTHINLFRRLEKLMISTPCIDAIFREIIKRMCETPQSVLATLNASHPRDLIADIRPFLRRHGHDW